MLKNQLITIAKSLGLPQHLWQFCNPNTCDYLRWKTDKDRSTPKICISDYLSNDLTIRCLDSRICRFLASRLTRCSCYSRNLWGYWTDLDHMLRRCIAIEYVWSNWNCHIPFRFGKPACKMPKNWLPWQRSLRNWKKRSRLIIYEQVSIIWCKDCKNRFFASERLLKKKEN